MTHILSAFPRRRRDVLAGLTAGTAWLTLRPAAAGEGDRIVALGGAVTDTGRGSGLGFNVNVPFSAGVGDEATARGWTDGAPPCPWARSA